MTTRMGAWCAVWVLCAVAPTRASELAPYYPPPRPETPRGTTIAPGDVAVTLPDGTGLRPGAFRTERPLNGTWKFSGLERRAEPFPDESNGYETPDFDDAGWDDLAVPLNWYRRYPEIYDARECYNRGFYRHRFTVSAEERAGRRVLLHFKFVGYEASLWINGRPAGRHHGDFVPWLVDITDFVQDGENRLTLRVEQDFGPQRGTVARAARTYGSQWSWNNIKGGVWGDVALRFEPAVRVKTLRITPRPADDTLRVDYEIDNHGGAPLAVDLGATVTGAMKAEANRVVGAGAPVPTTLASGANAGTLTFPFPGAARWTPERPHLYYLTLHALRDGQAVTARTERFGFRDFAIRDGRFFLNGERVYLFGENIASNDHGGNGLSTAEESHRLYRALAGFKARGYTMIRPAHMPIMEEALDIADEIGLMIYDEWSWAFTREIDEPEFQRRNDLEFRAWLERDFNHPSVTLWSCGNEVRHADNDSVRRQLDRQVERLRAFDTQARPAGSFSGSANWRSYGTQRLETDFLDHHSYLGNGAPAWTRWHAEFDRFYDVTLATYPPARGGARLDSPYILWECVGFSWGGLADPDFVANDTDRYAAYVNKPTSWARPNGVGYIGTLGLAAALDPARGMDYGKRLYGKRLLELVRQDERIAGFAPWFLAPGLDAATLWTQPVFPGLRNDRRLPPRNLFAGEATPLELFVVNDASAAVEGATVAVGILDAEGRRVELESFPLAALPGASRHAAPLTLIPPADLRGAAQIRVEVLRDGRVVGQNFYDVFVGGRAEIFTPLPEAPDDDTAVALLDVGHADDLAATSALLSRFGIKHRRAPAGIVPPGARLAVIPAAQANRQPPRLNRDALFAWVEAGGTLLVLEQDAGAGTLLGGTELMRKPQTMVDLVHPAHPAFKGLSPRHFDTWENPDNGYAIDAALGPFLANALATRGAFTGGHGVDNAVIEGTLGKGRIFWSQLLATRLAEQDSVAATYTRNVLAYLLAGAGYEAIRPLAREQREIVRVDPARLRPIDLSRFANRGFSDPVAGDGLGGWTDQGANDFRDMPMGRQNAGGVAFDILDPAKNGGASCLVLRGAERRAFPAEIVDIPLNDRFTRIFFLHAAAWSRDVAGCYRFEYADGGVVDYPLVHGVNIGDWWNPSHLAEAAPGITRVNAAGQAIGTYVAVWENPHPDRLLKCFSVLSRLSTRLGGVDYAPGEEPVPILVAATGEQSHERVVPVGARWIVGHEDKNVDPADKAEIAEVEVRLPDGTTGPARRITMKKPGQGGGPYAFAFFDADGLDPMAYRYLTFYASPERPGTLQVKIPEKDWKASMTRNVVLSGEGWRKVRLDLGALGQERFAGSAFRGEVFLFNAKDEGLHPPPGAISFLIASMTLE